MANEEIKERISLETELSALYKEQQIAIEKGNYESVKGNTTINDRVSLMEDAVKSADNNKKLQIIQNDLMKKANEFAKQGNTRLAKKYKDNAEIVTKKIQENKIEAENKKIQEKKMKAFQKQVGAVNGMAKGLTGVLGITGGIIGVFTKFTKMTATIGKNFGALGMTNAKFKNDLLDAGAEAASLGQEIKDVTSISKDLTDNFGFGRDESVAMAEGIMDTSMALGLSNEEGTNLLGTLTQIAGMSFDTAQNFSKQVALLADAEGVSPTTVMRDIAKSSKTIAMFTGMTPDNLAKAAIQATKLGTTLDAIAGSMEGVLNFQDSLNKEIEASILLGRDVNLQKARELALAGETEAFTVEITKQVGSQAEFQKMNLFQRRALAAALSMEESQLAKMVTNQDKVRSIGEAIAQQPGLEKMIGRESMDNMAKIVADLQRAGAELVISIGPTVAAIAGGFATVTKSLSESKVLLPIVTGLLGLMLGKSIANFVFSAATALGKSAGFMGPLGLGLILGIPAILAPIVASLMQLRTGTEIAGIKSDTVAQLHAGETVLNARDSSILGAAVNGGGMSKQDMEQAVAGGMRGLVEENKRIREQNETLINETRRQAGRFAEAMESMG